MFRKLIPRCLARGLKHLLRESQCGFCNRRGCVDQVLKLRVLAEKAIKFNTPLYLCFVDLRKGYDLVNRDALQVVLRRKSHLPDKLLQILEALHNRTIGAVWVCGRLSGKSDITNGVRQGDLLVPICLTYFWMQWFTVICSSFQDVACKFFSTRML